MNYIKCIDNRIWNAILLPMEAISKYRVFIMSAAMLAIMLFHQRYICNPFFEVFHLAGYLGVDVFFFLSGYGIVHSLRKNSLGRYYANRFFRIVPIFLIVGLIKYSLSGTVGFHSYVESTFKSVWFIYAILVFYVVAPAVHKTMSCMGTRMLKWLPAIVLVLVFWLVVVVDFSCVHTGIMGAGKIMSFLRMMIFMALPRFPAFVWGMVCVPGVLRSDRGLIALVLCSVIVTVLVLNKYYIVFLFVPALPTVCLWLAEAGRFLSRFRLIYATVCVMGACSLELYLWHEWVFYKAMLAWRPYLSGWVLLPSAIMLSACIAWVTHRVCEPLTRLHKRKNIST